MKLSVFYEHIREAAGQSSMSLEEICTLVKSFGIDALELDADRFKAEEDTILTLLKKTGLTVSCMYGFFDFGHITSSALREEQITSFLSMASRAGASRVLVIPGFLAEHEEDPASMEHQQCVQLMKNAVAAMCSAAKPLGITVGMEDFDDSRAPFATTAQLLSFVEEIPELSCFFDTGNFLYSGEDVLEAYSRCKPYIGYVHCKDRTFEVHPGEEPKLTVNGRAMYAVPAGGGCIPMKELVTYLLKSGYDDTFVIEHFGSQDQLAYMKQSAEWLLNLRKEVLGG
ncbi:sugar phosphate isomerase/epimerase family protein [Paenibacillus typhae]|uniref:sugar phosphate isomerase/epimerase family protein n=1 Tax=Paenibacillus typhae TaxID=1174501 RepID=UPI001C8DE2C0|nr:sugar phosphate isomerase/epimerase [Paenibacillus typhae]MBY0013370.1 sugar phosphate isomerase/epimerase [Paenibacillus typhae]